MAFERATYCMGSELMPELRGERGLVRPCGPGRDDPDGRWCLFQVDGGEEWQPVLRSDLEME